MTEDKAQTEFSHVIEIDPQRLEKVVIDNMTGPTYVVGTNAAQVRVRARTTDGQPFNPEVELKNDGRKLEISGQLSDSWHFQSQKWVVEPEVYDDGEGWDEERREDFQRNFRREYRQQARRDRRFMRDFDPSQIGEFVGEMAQNVMRWAERGNIELYVEIPWGVELEVKSLSGTIDVRDMRGFCRLQSTSGAVSLLRLSGGLSLKNMSGRLEAAELSGRVTARVISGKVQLWDCHMSALDLTTTSGQITVETDLGVGEAGDYRINSTSGHVDLRLPATAPVTVDCRTLSGRLNLPQSVRPSEMRNRPGQSQARFDLNGGGRRVSVNTLSGHIELSLFGQNDRRSQPRQNQEMPPRWPDMPVPPVPPAPGRGFVPPVPPAPPFPPMPPMPPTEAYSGFVPPVTPPAPYQPNFSTIPPMAGSEWPTPVAQAKTDTEQEAARPEPASPADGSVEPTPEPFSDKKTRQMAILEALERGEISVEDGMARLNALENN